MSYNLEAGRPPGLPRPSAIGGRPCNLIAEVM